MSYAIHVWRWEDAPQDLRDLDNGSDRDWLALVHRSMANQSIEWARDGTPFGVSAVYRYELPNGDVVLVGAHA